MDAGANDRVLARLAAAGDRGAYGELVRRSLPAVRSLLRRMGAQPALADDVAQDAFIAAMRAIGSYRAESSFAAWVMRIAARLFLRRCRNEARLVSLEDTDAAGSEPTDTVDLDRALASLSPMERLCVSLCHGAGFSHSELAAELDLPLGTVKSHVLRGTRRLRDRLGIEELP